MIYGNLQKALEDPHNLVITEHIADKYFPGENPVGRTMILNDDTELLYTIGEVIGSLKMDLVSQLLTESMIFSFLSITAGILRAWVLLPSSYLDLLPC